MMIEIKVNQNESVRITPREAQLLAMIAEGSKDAAIAHKLYISRKTVENHLHNLYEKLNVRSPDKHARCLATRVAVQNEMLLSNIND
jgi:DNA-binding NarL/FixJ family response regulator